jgi:branched-chain amino acid transport system substrate-binding protein
MLVKQWKHLAGRFLVTGCAALAATAALAQQHPKEVKVGLVVPLSGIYARHAEVMRMGAELGVEHINAQGGIKALGGAKLKLVVIDAGDSTEKTKNAAQRMVAQEPDMVAATGAFISSFTLALTEVTERAKLPVLTLSFADAITSRGFKYIFQTSAPASVQSENALPEILRLAEQASGKRPKSVAIVSDTNQSSQDSMKPMRERLLKQHGIELRFDETWTPPLADATPLVQKVRSTRPEMLFFLPNSVGEAKLFLEKMSEFGLGRGKVPVITFSVSLIEPSLLKNTSQDLLEGLIAVVGNWQFKGHEKLQAEFKAKYNEPWVIQNAISTYGDMWIIKEALEVAKKADKEALAVALRKIDLTDGAAKYFPGGRVKFDENGRRVGAGFVVVQWQNGKPLTVYPPEIAVATPIWIKP